MARAIWKGVIGLGDLEVPVKLYSAIQPQGVSFRLLHRRTREPVKQRMIDPSTGDAVPTEEIYKGYEAEPGIFVMLGREELATLEPAPSRAIAVTRCVPRAAIPHAWFDRPYYLGPDGDPAACFALARALAKREDAAVVRWVMRKQDYAGALLAHGDHLMLVTLRQAGEVIPASALSSPGGRAPTDREVAMAKQLVNALTGELDMSQFRDEYRERVLELVAARASGKSVRLKKPKTKQATDDALGKLLEASLKKTKERKVA